MPGRFAIVMSSANWYEEDLSRQAKLHIGHHFKTRSMIKRHAGVQNRISLLSSGRLWQVAYMDFPRPAIACRIAVSAHAMLSSRLKPK
jgi:hypothetical protein